MSAWSRGLALVCCAAALIACGNKGVAAGDRAPSPSALTEPPPKALGAKAASAQPLDGGNVGSLPDEPDDPDDGEQDPLSPPPTPQPTPAEPDGGVAL